MEPIKNELRNNANIALRIINNTFDDFNKMPFRTNDEMYVGDSELDNSNKLYSSGAIFYTEYRQPDIKNEDKLLKDLREVLKVYDKCASSIKDAISNSSKDNDNRNENEMTTTNDGDDNKKDALEHNLIVYGAPGTGKSHKLKKDIEFFYGNDEDIKKYTERVTFHPDYSYANFVGTYKPVPDEKNKDIITYKYVPGPFMRIYSKAKLDPDHHTYILVIEEINRAMVSAVFGDIFQLLDRDKIGDSEFPVHTSEDAKNYLRECWVENPEILSIPSNLYIWATMNSADQGVFPMDTAFKRRWNFEYLDIDNGENEIKSIEIKKNNQDDQLKFNWNALRKKINEYLIKSDVNEDKLMGPFFISPSSIRENKNSDIDPSWKIFKNKVIMYLYEDAGKQIRYKLFGGASSKNCRTYSQICKYFDEVGIKIFNTDITENLMEKPNHADNE